MSSNSASSNSENSSNTENFIAPAMDNIENLCKLMSLELVNILSKQYNFDANEACNFLGIEYSTENLLILEESDSDTEHSVKDNADEGVSGLTNSIGQLSVSDAKVDRKKKVPTTETEVEEKKPTKARAKKVANTNDVIAPASTEDTEEKKKPAKARASAKKTKTDEVVASASTEDTEEKKKPAKARARASAKKTNTDDEDAPAKNTNSDDGDKTSEKDDGEN